MTILDRMLFFSFLRAYFICLMSTLSLYIIVDLFTNIDAYAVKANGTLDIVKNILNFYGHHMFQYYDRLCEAIALLAAMFTVAWMQRNNELLPVLSAGVSTHRILRPILLGSLLMLAIGVANQELIIPRIAKTLMSDREDPEGDKDVMVHPGYEPNGIHIEGNYATPKEQAIKFFYVTLPETQTSTMVHLSAASALYIPPSDDPISGGWLLTGASPPEIDAENSHEMLVPLFPGKYFIRTRELSFEVITRNPKWYALASTETLYTLLNKPGASRQGQVAVIFHMRISRIVIGMLLVILGLSIVLRDQNRHMFISAGLCLAMCAIFFAVIFASKFLGDGDYVSPALAAWLPVLIFGPIAVAQYDAIHT